MGGFASAANRRMLRAGNHHRILGEKPRSDSAEIQQALSRQGRYAVVVDNLRVKEVELGESDRFIICRNPDEAERDAAVRARLVAAQSAMIDGLGKPSATRRAELRGVIPTKPSLNRYPRVTPGGLLRINQQATAAKTKPDGTYPLRCSDPHLSAEDITLGYKQLLEVERGWRTRRPRSTHARSPTGSNSASAPTSPSAGWRCC